MQTPAQIDFQGIAPQPELREKIARHIGGLEDRFGRITACRVILKAPSDHHRTGQYGVHVRLALPSGKDVNIAHTPRADERYTDIDFALNDTFKRARRRLQDQVRRLQGKVKSHAP
jgi:ribosome-associated translation inhibitor RaiA